jgi:hypothetical protein
MTKVAKTLEGQGLEDVNEVGNEAMNQVPGIETIGSDLEQVKEVLTGKDFSSAEWLENNDFEAIEGNYTAQYNAAREPRIQEGLKKLGIKGFITSGGLMLLAKHWENKAARETCINLMKEEAIQRKEDKHTYIQGTLRKQVDDLLLMAEAAQRLTFVLTYLKPRPSQIKDKEMPVLVGNKKYSVSILLFTEAKIKFGDDKDALKAYILENAREITETIETL